MFCHLSERSMQVESKRNGLIIFATCHSFAQGRRQGCDLYREIGCDQLE